MVQLGLENNQATYKPWGLKRELWILIVTLLLLKCKQNKAAVNNGFISFYRFC